MKIKLLIMFLVITFTAVSQKEGDRQGYIFDESKLINYTTPFPNFKLKNLNGNKVSKKDLLNKPSLLMLIDIPLGSPYYERVVYKWKYFYEKYKNSVNIILISRGSKEQFIKFLKESKFEVPVLVKGDKLFKDLELNKSDFPPNFFLDRKGIIKAVKVLASKGDENNSFEKEIEKLLVYPDNIQKDSHQAKKKTI